MYPSLKNLIIHIEKSPFALSPKIPMRFLPKSCWIFGEESPFYFATILSCLAKTFVANERQEEDFLSQGLLLVQKQKFSEKFLAVVFATEESTILRRFD